MMKKLSIVFFLIAGIANAQDIKPATCNISGGTITCPSGSLTPSTGSGTVTTVSVTTANGVSGSVANPTTTPAISLTLNAITPSSISTAGQITSTLAIGTAPFSITSTTLVPNLYVQRSVLADSVTTNANLTGPITSVGNATSVASQTGTGSTFVMSASPTGTGTWALPIVQATSVALGGATIGTDALAVTGTINASSQLHWFGGGATNIWAASTGLAGSTQIDMTFRNNTASNSLNVATFQNTASTGYSAIRFVDNTGVEHGAVGYGNGSVAGAAFNQITYLESFAPANSGTGLNAFVPISFVQSNSSGQTTPMKITASRETWLAAVPTSSAGNVFGIRANSRTYAGNATSVSSILRMEQLGDAAALVVYAPSASVTMTTSDGFIRGHIEHTSSTAPLVVARNDGTGAWFDGRNGSETSQFKIGYNGGTPNIFANGGVLQFGAGNVASGAIPQTLTFQGNTGSATTGPKSIIQGAGGGSGSSTGGELALYGGLSSAAAGTGGDITGYTAPAAAGNAAVERFRAYATGGFRVGIAAMTLTGGALGLDKITASASAPGAGGAKFELVCGTNAGTAKLTIGAGTSATMVTVVDNIGAGVTGC